MTTSRSLCLAPFLAIALAACGGAQPAPAAPATPAEPSAAAPATPATPAAPEGAPAAPAKAKPTMPGPNITPDGVVFNFKPEGSGKDKKIFLAGTFNEWNPANPQYLMTDDDGDGTWSITLKLAPGTYQYKFVADGKWIKDPYSPSEAPDGYGGRNGKFDVK